MGIYMFFGVQDPFDPRCTLVTSNLVSPTVLGLFRLTLAIYTTVAIIFMMAWEGIVTHDVDSYFSYFTHLSYIGLTSYFWASSVQTLNYASRVGRGAKPSYALQQWGPFTQVLHVLLNATVYVAPFIVTIVFWTLLASGAFANTFTAWDNISMHILNTVFTVSEIILSRCVPTWSSLPVLLVICVLYIALAYVTYATQHFYTYSFLDPSKQHAFVAVYILGMLIGTIVVLAVVKGVCALRDKLFRNVRVQVVDTDVEYVDLGAKA